MVMKSNIDGVDVILEGDELDAFLSQRKKDAEEAAAFDAKMEAEVAARKAILEKLGLTEQEAKLLLG